MSVDTWISIGVAIVALAGLIFREFRVITDRMDKSIKSLEEKLTLAQDKEIKRNDEIVGRIDSEAKETAKDQKELVQRVTACETICKMCEKRFKGGE